jgi:hypothetical protein
VIDNKFNLQDKVKIISLDISGVVISIYIVAKAITYQVRYCWQGKFEEVYFYEWELLKEQ